MPIYSPPFVPNLNAVLSSYVGSEITNYVVEKRDTMNGNWVTVTSSIARTTCRVSGLLGGNEYTFRVMAENRHGLSSPVLSETVIAKYPFGKIVC